MHPNPAFRKADEAKNIAFARLRSFGTLAINADNGPLMSHIPFQLSQDGRSLEAHLVRSNPILGALLEPRAAVIAVSGGDGYISPDWYGIDDQVPTWNYVAVHLRGTVRRLADDELPGVLDRLSADMEKRLLPKTPWTRDKMGEGVFERMCRQIAPIAMEIKTVEGTWKLSQNKPDDVRLSAARHFDEDGFGQQTKHIAGLMRDAADT